MGKRENHSVKKQLLALGLAALMVSGNLEPVAAAQNTGAVVSDETETGELSGSKAQEAGNPASQDGKNVPGGVQTDLTSGTGNTGSENTESNHTGSGNSGSNHPESGNTGSGNSGSNHPITDNSEGNRSEGDPSSNRLEYEAVKEETDSPYFAVVIEREEDFPEGSRLVAEFLEGGELDSVLSGLQQTLEEQEISVVLPLAIAVLDENGEEQKDLGQASVQVFAEEAESLEDLELWHRKADDTWESLPYELHGEDETETSYAEFETESFSPFLFVRTNTPSSGQETGNQDGDVPVPEMTGDEVQNITINSLSASFVSGAERNDENQLVWAPTDSAAGHVFVYRLNYAISGVHSIERGAVSFELPLHILKDRGGNWADTFEAPYPLENEVPDGSTPDFVYRIDEENNKAIIYNYGSDLAGGDGYIEFSYTMAKETFDYVDGAVSDKITAVMTAKNNETEQRKETEAEAVSIDTYARIVNTRKEVPTYYEKWQSSWGEEPEDAGDYYYLVWMIGSYIRNTSPYTLTLEDSFSDLGGSVVGYRFAGQHGYSMTNYLENQTESGNRYDYVLTKYSKNEASQLLNDNGGYQVKNMVQATVTPTDQKDPDTTARASRTWSYEVPEYETPEGHLWSEKYGVYGEDKKIVSNSTHISNYTLAEFQAGRADSIDNLQYYLYGEGYPFPWILGDDADGTINDILEGRYGKKKVTYILTDSSFSLEDDEPLTDEDYDLTGLEWNVVIQTITGINEETMQMQIGKLTEFADDDEMVILVRESRDGEWQQAAVYKPKSGSYSYRNSSYIESASGGTIKFKPGVKGVEFRCSNAYYHTKINLYPEVSLKNTEHVMSLAANKDRIKLINYGSVLVTDSKGGTLMSRFMEGTDYIQRAVREPEIRKTVAQTRNNKDAGQFEVTWSVSAGELYIDDDGKQYVYQNSGVFYDLVPSGAVADLSSVSVTASGNELIKGSYTVEAAANYKGTGRTLLIVRIKEPTESVYQLSYKTIHSYNSVYDYGKNLLNTVAYETGNEYIAGGSPDDGGAVTEKDLMAELDPETDAERFLYTEARYNINIITASSTGLAKQVKSESDLAYSYETTVYQGGGYSYQVRLVNDALTSSKDIIFFDSLENFYQNKEDTKAKIPSDWKGTLAGIDISNLTSKNIDAVVYLSRLEDMNVWNHLDLNEKTADGGPVWLEYSEFEAKYGLEAARAVAVDAGKTTSGDDYVLNGSESLVFTIYMKAPQVSVTDDTDPVAYNNIFVSKTKITAENTEIPEVYHQDYTQLHYRVTGDLSLKKVNAADTESPVPGASYLLRGTSDYGTIYQETRITDKTGSFSFENIEKGTYELLESDCDSDWQLDRELHTVVIDASGNVSISGFDRDGDTYIAADEPRIHADLTFLKIDGVTKSPVIGAKFLLSGTSSYGNEILMYGESAGERVSGVLQAKVVFSDLELGTYELVETEVPEGYIKSNTVWTVKVDERGVAVLYEGGKAVSTSLSGYYQIENEPYHSVRFLKSSSYGENIYLEGAEFSLVGVSDYGTSVTMTAVSASLEEGGLVVFDHLEPGTYILKETKAPEDHELDETSHTVVVYADGNVEISGLEKTAFGSAELYDFQNFRTAGLVCVTKRWSDTATNEERPVPDITISTKKPTKNPIGATLRFDANGGTFTDGSSVNELVYAGKTLADGSYLEPLYSGALFSGWYLDKACKVPYDTSNLDLLDEALTSDLTVYAGWKTFDLMPGSKFSDAVKGYISGIKNIEFTDDPAPESATLIDVDADGDGGVVAWKDTNKKTLYISTQTEGMKVIANKDSSKLFNTFDGIESIYFLNFDTSQATNMSGMFYNCRYLQTLDVSSFDTSKVTDMHEMFYNCTLLGSLDVSGFDTSLVTDMSGMFTSAYMTSLDLSMWDTSRVTNMSYMFENCKNLTSLDVSNFNTSQVTNMSYMFWNCDKLTSLDVSNFNTSQVTNMSYMFSGCESLTFLEVSNFNTGQVTDMSYMFQNCKSLTSLDVSKFNTSQVTNMSYMFSGCKSLTSLDVSGFNTYQVNEMAELFADCRRLEGLDLSSFDFSSAYYADIYSMLTGCELRWIKIDWSFIDSGCLLPYSPGDCWYDSAGKKYMSYEIYECAPGTYYSSTDYIPGRN